MPPVVMSLDAKRIQECTYHRSAGEIFCGGMIVCYSLSVLKMYCKMQAELRFCWLG